MKEILSMGINPQIEKIYKQFIPKQKHFGAEHRSHMIRIVFIKNGQYYESCVMLISPPELKHRINQLIHKINHGQITI